MSFLFVFFANSGGGEKGELIRSGAHFWPQESLNLYFLTQTSITKLATDISHDFFFVAEILITPQTHGTSVHCTAFVPRWGAIVTCFFSSHFALKWHVHGIIAILKELVATNPAAASGATERLIKHTTLVLVGRTSVSVGDEAACLGLARTPVLISASIAWFVPEKLSSWSCVP